jgi:sulfite dehydrogenase (quinone) subunit SoeC
MNPAYSVILFTTASGAGYGLLTFLGLVGFNHGKASSLGFAVTSLVIALALITTGLLSSTLHLGHPERAWRAFSQWRSSWLSREGIAAVATYPIALLFGAAWSGLIDAPSLIAPLGAVTALMCILTVFCTGKIYSTLKTIRAWSHPLTVPAYISFALATGATILLAITLAFSRFQLILWVATILAIGITLLLKVAYWQMIDAAPRTHTMAQATGLGEGVRQWEVPHTATNFIMKEMGFVVARKHAQKLRNIVIVLMIVAALCVYAIKFLPWLGYLAPLAAFAAAWVERWLFFAEAEHVSSLYYGNAKA